MKWEPPKLRAFQKLDDPLDTLLHGLRLDDMRTVLARLSNGAPPAVSSRIEAKEKILEAGDLARITATVYQVQASSPFSHCFFARYPKIPKDTIEALLSRSGWKSSAYGYRFPHAFRKDRHCYATFERDIEVKVKVASEKGDLFKLQPVTITHPIVVRLDTDTGLFTISYPGFNQAQINPSDRVKYSREVDGLLNSLKTAYGLHPRPLPVKSCITKLADSESNRLRVIRSNPTSENGRFKLASLKKDIPVEAALLQLIKDKVSSSAFDEVSEAFKDAINEAPTDSMMLFWTREEIFTRLEYWDIGTEFYIVWRGASQTFAKTDDIAGLLFALTSSTDSDPKAEAWNRVAHAQPGMLFGIPDLSNTCGVTVQESQAILLSCLASGLVETVYNIVGAELVDETVSWTTVLAELGRKFSIGDDNSIDGADPNNIQVAFRRTRTEGAS